MEVWWTSSFNSNLTGAARGSIKNAKADARRAETELVQIASDRRSRLGHVLPNLNARRMRVGRFLSSCRVARSTHAVEPRPADTPRWDPEVSLRHS
jgi:hypothetical protein